MLEGICICSRIRGWAKEWPHLLAVLLLEDHCRSNPQEPPVDEGESERVEWSGVEWSGAERSGAERIAMPPSHVAHLCSATSDSFPRERVNAQYMTYSRRTVRSECRGGVGVEVRWM